MEYSSLSLSVLIVSIIVLCAFFAASEIAFLTTPQHVIDALVKKRIPGSKLLAYLKQRTDKLLIVILVGNTLVLELNGMLINKLADNLHILTQLNETLTHTIVVVIVTILILLFGEIIPKSIASRSSTNLALSFAGVYKILMVVMQPVVFVMEKLIKLFHTSKHSHIRSVSVEEIESLIDIAKDQDNIEEDMAKHIKKVIDFHDTTVQEIMTPRVRVEAIKANATINETIAKMDSYSHTRIPVFNKRIDEIERLVSYKEMISYRDKNMGERILEDLPLKKAYKIPLTMPLDKLIEVFRKERRQFAVVMDEYGGVAGIVTLEDIIEEVFGDFLDETDKELIPIKNDGDYYIIQSAVLIDDVLDALDLTWHDIGLEENEYSGETVGYVITSELERFPEKNEKLVFESELMEGENKTHSDDVIHKALHIEIAKRDDNTIHEIIAKVVI